MPEMTRKSPKELGPLAKKILDASLQAPIVPPHRLHSNALAAAFRAAAVELLPAADPADPCCALVDNERKRIRRAIMKATSELEKLDWLV
jgi:hypothetical protein